MARKTKLIVPLGLLYYQPPIPINADHIEEIKDSKLFELDLSTLKTEKPIKIETMFSRKLKNKWR